MEISAGTAFGAAAALPPPNTSIGKAPQNRPMFWKMNETPIADTSGASFGALRSGSIDEAIHREIERGRERSTRDHDSNHSQDDAERPRALQTQEPDQRQRQERRQHEQIAVGEVDQLQDAVDHGVAERDQGEHHAVGEPDDQLLIDQLHGTYLNPYFCPSTVENSNLPFLTVLPLITFIVVSPF